MSKEDKPAPAVNDTVSGYAAIIKDHVIKDEGTHNVSDKEPASAFIATLPEGLTPNQVDMLRIHDTNFVAAATKVTGDFAIEAMAKDKGAALVTGTFGMMGDISATATVMREKTFQPPPKADGTPSAPVTHYGYTTTAVSNTATSGKQYKAVVANLRQDAAELLGKD